MVAPFIVGGLAILYAYGWALSHHPWLHARLLGTFMSPNPGFKAESQELLAFL